MGLTARMVRSACIWSGSFKIFRFSQTASPITVLTAQKACLIRHVLGSIPTIRAPRFLLDELLWKCKKTDICVENKYNYYISAMFHDLMPFFEPIFKPRIAILFKSKYEIGRLSLFSLSADRGHHLLASTAVWQKTVHPKTTLVFHLTLKYIHYIIIWYIKNHNYYLFLE